MLLGVPLVQVALFGFAIELTPRILGVTVVASTADAFERARQSLERDPLGANLRRAESAAAARRSLARSETQVVVDVDELPVRVDIDGTDPVLAAHARAAIERYAHQWAVDAGGVGDDPIGMRVTTVFNPAARTQPYLVSGLLGLILTMTLVMMSALCVARERERGTLENLMALGVQPIQLAVGKLAPYLLIGILQGAAVLLLARLAFGVVVQGSWVLLAVSGAVFAFTNLCLGFLFSNLARAQMPAMQMTFFFFLPSSLLSGFMFPFSAMPGWARAIGEALPLTHFLRIVRGIALRGVDADYVVSELIPIVVIGLVVGAAAIASCQRLLHRGPA